MSAPLAYAAPQVVSRLKERLTASVRLQRIRDELDALTEMADAAYDEASATGREDYAENLERMQQVLSFARSEINGVESQLKWVMI